MIRLSSFLTLYQEWTAKVNGLEYRMIPKWDAGLGLRLWAKSQVARIDVAGSDEGFGVAMKVSQPFQF